MYTKGTEREGVLMKTKNLRNHQTSTSKSYNFIQFLDQFYGNPLAQFQFFYKTIFPQGFVCPECGHIHFSWLAKRRVCVCTRCGHHVHIFAGTVFQDTKLSFSKLLIGIYYFAVSQSGISGTELAINMGVNVNTARLFLRKIRTACKTQNDTIVLGMKAELDCANLGGVDEGGKRGAGAKKQTVAVAVEYTTGSTKRGRTVDFPGRAKIELIRSENAEQIIEFTKRCIHPKSLIRSDRGHAINALSQTIRDIDGNVVKRNDGSAIKRYDYELINAKFDKHVNPLDLVHNFISNLKALFHGIYHGVSIPYMDLFVEEYTWRYNQRTCDNNLHKVKMLIEAIFKTPVRTADNFKEYYSKVLV